MALHGWAWDRVRTAADLPTRFTSLPTDRLLLSGLLHIKHHHPHRSEFYFFLIGTAVVYVDGDEVNTPRHGHLASSRLLHSIRNVGEDAVDLVYGLSRPEYGEIGFVYDE